MAFDFGNFLGNVAGGAGAGSAAGPWGTALGGVAGAVYSLFSGGGKKKNKKKKLSRFDENQAKLYQQKYDALQGKGPLGDIYSHNPEKANKNFDLNYDAPATRNWLETKVPEITGQYRKNNTFNSSYSGEALARSGRDLQEGLNAKRYDYLYKGEENAKANKRDSIDKLLSMQTFDYDDSKGGGNFIDELIETGGKDAGKWFVDFLKKRGNTATVSGSLPANK
jgi:hypothetical protein